MSVVTALPLVTGANVYALGWSATGQTCVYTSNDRHAYLWHASGATTLDLSGHPENVTGVAVSPNGAVAASVATVDEVRVWDATTGTLTAVLQSADGLERVPCPLFAVAVDGERVAAITTRGMLRVWNLPTGDITLATGPAVVSQGGNARVALGHGGHLATWANSMYRLWDRSSQLLYQTEGETVTDTGFVISAGRITDLLVDRDGQIISSVSGAVRVRSRGGQILQELPTTVDLGALALTPDGLLLCAGFGCVFAWDLEAGRWRGGLPNPPHAPAARPLSLHVTTAGDLLASWSDGTVTAQNVTASLHALAAPPPKPRPEGRSTRTRLRDGLAARRMTRTAFWGLIEASRRRADAAGGSLADRAERQAEALTDLLSERSPGEIIAFHRLFQARMAESYRSELLAVAVVVGGGRSDDGFEYFRAWLIGQGHAYYEAALRDAQRAADRIGTLDEGSDAENEALWDAAAEAYEIVTGTAVPDIDSAYPTRKLEPSWDEADLPSMFPDLWARLYGDAPSSSA